MSVKLEELYNEMKTEFHIKLLTDSCFQKMIEWFHVIDNIDYSYVLHGGELIFNSSLNSSSDKDRRFFIEQLIEKGCGGLVVAKEDDKILSEELIAFCNQNHFPLFSSSMTTSFMEIMRCISVILLETERRETNLVSAFRAAVHYPKDDKYYLSQFAKNQFIDEDNYIVSVFGMPDIPVEQLEGKLDHLNKSFHYVFDKYISFVEEGFLIVLSAGKTAAELETLFEENYGKQEDIRIGIGSCQNQIQNLFHSFAHARATYYLTEQKQMPNIISYRNIGVYRLLTNVKDEMLYQEFLDDVLGKLIKYDQKHQTAYVELLETFFENDCNAKLTSEATFCHKNTLYNKLEKIEKILGFDITSNEGRLRIMLAFYILKMNH